MNRDDVYVNLTLENYFEGWDGGGDPPNMTFLRTQQLTRGQMVTLAEDPELTS